ncbi:hypothetical protein C1645_833926 [Glomus cerebriforme]|uniref:Uncharacterized protein n=1 Tax=Glomus cerebriforme TaxID=658196 RepID=A0A397SAM9_9GLOM|nr:hypothetical protein C1645_833926 [Glomus cerebriforme]
MNAYIAKMYFKYNILHKHSEWFDKTNALEFELYVIVSQFDSFGFAIVYLFIKDIKKDNRV